MSSALSGLEAEEEKQVLLGLPGAWAVDSSEPSDHYTTKIGGHPDWPPPVQPSLLREELLKCAVCGGLIGLVAQVHAPLSLHPRKHLSDRTLYIFGCLAPGCGLDPSCWRTIRVQNDHTVTTDAGELTTTATNNCASLETRTESLAVETSGDWWEAENLWGGENLDRGANVAQHADQFLNMNEFAASLEEAGRLAAEIAQEDFRSSEGNGVGRIMNGRGSTRRSSGASAVSALPMLPCFYVYFQGELIGQGKADKSPPSSRAKSLQATTVNPSEENGDCKTEVWEGEEYEPDRALHVDRTYLRFRKHLDRNPEQCLRYCFGGEVLWAVEEDAIRVAPGNCVGCGGPRVYELQLMPSLLYFLQQAMKHRSAPVVYTLDEWDWFTLIVFSCAQSCSQKRADEDTLLVNRDWSIMEETTILQWEAVRICHSDLGS